RAPQPSRPPSQRRVALAALASREEPAVPPADLPPFCRRAASPTSGRRTHTARLSRPYNHAQPPRSLGCRKIACLLDTDFEHSEYTQPAEAFSQAGHEVTVIGLEAGKELKGKKNATPVT